MPEKTLKKLNSHILPQWKVCFFASIIIGLIAHLYKITNWLPNWDSLVFRYDSQNMIGLGRWFLPVVCSFSSFYDLPFLTGIIAIIFHALSGVVICKILDIKKSVTAFLIGGILVSFPAVTSVMMYAYVADGYAISFFLATLAALFMTGKKPKVIVPAILIALSVGIYQAYITVTIMLILLKLIDEIMYNNISFATVFKKGIRMLLTGALGMAIYGIVLKILLMVLKTDLLDYQGINSTASLSGIDIFASLYTIKETFVYLFFDISNGISLYVVLNAFVLIFSFFYYIKHIIKNKIYKKPLNLIVLVALVVVLILGAGILAFANATVDYHNLMLMGYSAFYLLFVILYERDADKKTKNTEFKCWTVLILSLILIGNQTVISNVSYHKAQMAYEKSYGVLIRIADRIEQTENAKNCEKIVVIGSLDNSADYSVNLPPDITGITDGYIIRADDETVHQSVLTSALNDYCEMNYQFIYGTEKQKFIQREDVAAMDKWPSKSSVAVIDNTLVIKLGTEGEL